MTEINDLRERVEAAEKRFGLIDEQQSHYSERVIGLIEAIEAQLAAARSEIENQIAENRQLAEENEELRGMLHSVLRSIEEKTFTRTLQDLEARVSALVETDSGETEVAVALSEGLAREEMSAEDLLAEEASPEEADDLAAADTLDTAPDLPGAPAEIHAEADADGEALGADDALDGPEATGDAEAAAPEADPLILEAAGQDPVAAEEAPVEAPVDAPEEQLAATAGEEIAGDVNVAEESSADETAFDEAAGAQAGGDETAPEDISAEDAFAEEAAEEAAEESLELEAVEDELSGDPAGAEALAGEAPPEDIAPEDIAAEAPAESDDDDSVHELLAAMAELHASDVADAAILEANPEIAQLVEEAKALEAAAKGMAAPAEDEAMPAEPAAEAAPEAEPEEMVLADAASDRLSMETPEAAEAAEPDPAEPESAAPAAETAPTVKEIIRRVGDLARELERTEAQRRSSIDAAAKQAAMAGTESQGEAAIDHAASA